MDRILLLEDEVPLRNSLGRVLEAEGSYAMQGAGLLSEALSAIDKDPPDLIVSDLELPDGTGLSLIRELELRHRSIPMIFMTGYLKRYHSKLLQFPRLDVLEKPFQPEQLSALISRKLEEHRTNPPPPSVFTIADYLQLAGMARRSVTLEISRPSGPSAQIIVQDGSPVWAGDGSVEGPTAFRRLAMLPETDVKCHPSGDWDGTPNLDGSLEQQLLEAARVADESSRPPPRRSPPTRPPDRNRAPKPPRPRTLPKPSAPPASIRAKRIGAGTSPAPEPPTSTRETFPTPQSERHQPVSKEMPKVNLPLSTESGIDLSQVVTLSPGLKAVARADLDGSVLGYSGEIDAETACAIATMASKQLGELASELGLGDASSWQVSTHGTVWYVINGGHELVIALGEPNKNAASVLTKVAEGCRRTA